VNASDDLLFADDLIPTHEFIALIAVVAELLQPFRLEPGAPLISDKVSVGKFGAKADYSL
jgi:hypothetical protein